MRDAQLIAYMTDAKGWALHRPVLNSLVDVVNRHAAGVKVSVDEIDRIEAQRARRRTPRAYRNASPDGGDGGGDPSPEELQIDRLGYVRLGRVAVVPVCGVLAQHADMVNGVSQPRGMAYSQLVRAVRAADEDGLIDSIVLDTDSPGGSVAGVSDAVRAVRETRKPIHAYADLMASGADWVGSQCDSISISPTGVVGSIGVYEVVVDTSKAAEKAGRKVYVVKSGKYKGIGTPGAPVSEDDLAQVGREVGAMTDVFIEDVAVGLKMTPEAVALLADGSVRIGQGAVDAKLADRVESFDDLINRLNGQTGDALRHAAASPTRKTVAKRRSNAMEQAPTREELEKMDGGGDLIEEIKEEGRAEEQEKQKAMEEDKEKAEQHDDEEDKVASFAQLDAAFDDKSFVAECLRRKMTMSQAMATHMKTLESELAAMKAERAEKAATDDALGGAGRGSSPVSQGAGNAGGGGGSTFEEAAVALLPECDGDINRAVAKAAGKHRTLHADWLGRGCPMVKKPAAA